MIKKNMKLIIGIVLGLLVTTGVYAVNTLNASSISIDKTNMTKVPESNLQSALDYLYSKSKTTNMITIESGVEHDTQTYLGIAYLAPTNLSIKCTAANSISATGYKGEVDSSHSGCMKWYIYKDLGDSYKLILDHNTTAIIAWNTTGNRGINVAFAPNTTGDSDYDNLAYIELMKLSTTVENGGLGWVVEPDIISAAEVAEIVGKTDFTGFNSFYFDSKNATQIVNNQGESNYAWLFDNIGWSGEGDCTSSGCNVSDTLNSAGYWTRTPVGTAGSGSGVWRVDGLGRLNNYHAYSSYYGLRPVITVSKGLFS